MSRNALLIRLALGRWEMEGRDSMKIHGPQKTPPCLFGFGLTMREQAAPHIQANAKWLRDETLMQRLLRISLFVDRLLFRLMNRFNAQGYLF